VSRGVEIYVDGDACPVKDEVLRVAERHGVRVHLVANGWLPGSDGPLVNRVIVSQDADAADDWIAAHCGTGDVVVTADIPLAHRCLQNGARVLGHKGDAFHHDNIGTALATRDLKAQMREAGAVTGGARPFSKQDRSRFLQILENTVQAAKREI
jgi:uncharacterized protein YaiI (UPF0178 family)